jgi:hypothetical protein
VKVPQELPSEGVETICPQCEAEIQTELMESGSGEGINARWNRCPECRFEISYYEIFQGKWKLERREERRLRDAGDLDMLEIDRLRGAIDLEARALADAVEIKRLSKPHADA